MTITTSQQAEAFCQTAATNAARAAAARANKETGFYTDLSKTAFDTAYRQRYNACMAEYDPQEQRSNDDGDLPAPGKTPPAQKSKPRAGKPTGKQ